MKAIKLILICGVLVWFSALGYGAYRVYLSFDISDPLRLSRIGLKAAQLEKETEEAKQETLRQQAETAKTLARIERQRQLESSQAVSSAAVALAVFWRSLPLLLFASSAVGGMVYAFTRRVRIDAPITGVFPRKDAFRLASMALQVQYAESMGKVASFSEEVSRARLHDTAGMIKAFKGIAGRENVTINNALPEHAETQQQAGNVTFQQAVKDFRAGSVLLGYSAEKPEYMPVDSFVSCAFGGGSGSGKTSKLRFLLAQLILDGASISILDAHMGNKESLIDSLGNLANMPNVRVFNPFETQQAIATMLSDVQTAIDSAAVADVPNVFVLDELRPLNRACPDTELLMDKIANEGRKYGFYGVFSSQQWEARMFKQAGSAARDSCVLRMAARMPREQAKTLFKDGDSARVVSKLARPEMYADSMLFNGVVTVPFCSKEDCDALAAKYGRTNARQAVRQEIVSETIEETADDSDAVKTILDGHASNVIPFPVRNTNEPTNQLRAKSEPDTFDVKKLRESAGLSQGKFAELTGCSLSKLKRVETGGGSFDACEIAAILSKLNAWQKSGEPANQLRTNGEPGTNQTRTKHEPREA